MRRHAGGQRMIDGADLARFLTETSHPPELEFSVTESARNRFPGIVTKVEKEGLVAVVHIQAGPHRVVSLMTARPPTSSGSSRATSRWVSSKPRTWSWKSRGPNDPQIDPRTSTGAIRAEAHTMDDGAEEAQRIDHGVGGGDTERVPRRRVDLRRDSAGRAGDTEVVRMPASTASRMSAGRRGVPRFAVALAVVAVAFFVLPLVGLLQRAPGAACGTT